MIRSTLFRSVAPALRDSLNDAEVGALGMWLLMSAGAYPRGIAMCAKGGAGTDELEAAATARYTYPEGTPQEELMTRGMTNPEYRLPTASRMTATNAIAGLEDLMYTIVTSNEERDNPRRNADAPPMLQPVPDRDLTWHARPFIERAIPPPPQENGTAGRERALANMPRFTIDIDQVRVFAEGVARAERDAITVQEEAAHTEFVREQAAWLQERAVATQTDLRARQAAEAARLDELANRTRGIPNRR